MPAPDLQCNVYADWDRNGDFVGDPTTDYVTNGDFATDIDDWLLFGPIVASWSGGKMNCHRNGTVCSFYQNYTLRIRPGDQITVTFDVANPSATDKTYEVRVWNTVDVGEMVDVATILAGAPESTRTLVFDAALVKDWGETTRLAFLIQTDDASADPVFDMTFDNITLKRTHNKDDISAWWQKTDVTQGLNSADKVCANAGKLTLRLNNADKRFSQDNVYGPYYGDLNPGVPVKVAVTNNFQEWSLFQGEIEGWDPSPGHLHGDLSVTVTAIDAVGLLAHAGIGMPLQIDETAATLLDKVCSLAFDGDSATNTLALEDGVTQGDQVAVGDQTYTFVGELTGASNEVLIGISGNSWREPYSARNLARAIAADQGAGTLYGAATTRNKYVNATSAPNFGVRSDWAETWVPLQDAASAYEKLADAIEIPVDEEIAFTEVWLWMKKTGAPAGTMTLTLETEAYPGVPSGTLFDANATATVAESGLTTGGDWVKFTFAGEVTLNYYQKFSAYIVLTTDRASSGVNYVEWGWVATTGAAGLQLVAGTWGTIPLANEAVIFMPQQITLTANTPGAWGNALALTVTGTEYHANSLTITRGALAAGFFYNIYSQNSNVIQLSEVTGAPGFDYQLPFTVSGTATTFNWRFKYNGGSGHSPIVQVRDPVAAAWVTLATLNDMSAYEWQEYDISNPDYTSGAGVVIMRFYHGAPGNAGHSLQIDYAGVVATVDRTLTALVPAAATFSGGVDQPAGKTSFETGLIYPTAADSWAQSRKTGHAAARDVTQSNQGFFWADEAGDLIFHSYQWFFQQIVAAVDITLTDEMNDMKAIKRRGDIANEIIVEYIPRRESAAQSVVAQANGDIEVPSRNLGQRVNFGDAVDTTATVRLKYIEGETGNVVGAKNIVAPVAGTDYNVWTTVERTSQGTTIYGNDLTSKNYIEVSLAQNGGELEATFINKHTAPLVISGFQVRGTALITYDGQQIVRRDETSIAAYGLKPKTIRLPFPADRRFAESVAEYELNRRKDARTVIDQLQIKGTRIIDALNVYSLVLGNTVSITDQQAGISAVGHMIIGKKASIAQNGNHTLTWTLRKLFDPQVWILADTSYGQVGQTNVLGL